MRMETRRLFILKKWNGRVGKRSIVSEKRSEEEGNFYFYLQDEIKKKQDEQTTRPTYEGNDRIRWRRRAQSAAFCEGA